MSQSTKAWSTHGQFILGVRALTHSVRESADFMLKSLDCTRYWREKLTDPEFHCGTWGGARTASLDENTRFIIHFAVYMKTLESPQITAREMLGYLRNTLNLDQLEGDRGRRYINRIWESWGWTSKSATYRHINKYSHQNTEYYLLYRAYILTERLENILFYDESSFDPRALFRKRARAEKGKRAYAIKINHGPAQENKSINIGVMTSLRLQHGFTVLGAHTHAQDSLDFIESMIRAVEEGIVSHQSVVVMDNAPIHMSEEALVFVHDLFTSVGARLVLLPTYSPELNPCELIFAMIKGYLYSRKGDGTLLNEIAHGCATISWDHVFHMYYKCIFGATDEF